MKHVTLIMFTALGLSVLTASFIVVPVKERSSGSMHVQVRPHPATPHAPPKATLASATHTPCAPCC